MGEGKGEGTELGDGRGFRHHFVFRIFGLVWSHVDIVILMNWNPRVACRSDGTLGATCCATERHCFVARAYSRGKHKTTRADVGSRSVRSGKRTYTPWEATVVRVSSGYM